MTRGCPFRQASCFKKGEISLKVNKYVSLSVITGLLVMSLNTVLNLAPIQAMASSFDSANSLNLNGNTGSWTASIQSFSGTEVDNISLGGLPAFGINDPNAQNGKPAGQYLRLGILHLSNPRM